MTTSPYRRPALKLLARVRMWSKRLQPRLSSAGTLIVLAVLVAAGWLVIGFARTGLAVPSAKPSAAMPATRAALPATPVSTPVGGKPTTLSRREPIVYTVAGDNAFYHSPVHVMHEAERQAVAVSVARAHGLQPCPVCFKPPVR
jgi:hypothetical protein